MNIFESIKSDKTMTYSHWRYKLLHWTFRVKNPPSPMIPPFLYEYYCPLFWFTNLLLIILPIIILVKTVVYTGSTIFGRTSQLRNKVKAVQRARQRSAKEVYEKFLDMHMTFFMDNLELNDYPVVQDCLHSLERAKWHYLSVTEASYEPSEEQLLDFQELVRNTKSRIVELKRIKDSRKRNIERSVRIAEPVIKFSLIMLAVIMSVMVTVSIVENISSISQYISMMLTGSYNILKDIVTFIFSFNIWAVANFFVQLAILTIVSYLIGRLIGKLFPKLWPGIRSVADIVYDVCESVITMIKSFAIDSIDFIGTMYKNNCPKITIEDK